MNMIIISTILMRIFMIILSKFIKPLKRINSRNVDICVSLTTLQGENCYQNKNTLVIFKVPVEVTP